MGSGGSIQISPTVEISFIDQTTGELHKDEEINNIINQVTFDFNKEFYNAYKRTDKNSPYSEYKKWLEKSKR